MQLLHYALIFSLSISFPGGVSRASKFADVKSAGDCWAHVSPVGQGNTGAGVIPGSESSTLSKEGVASGGGGVVERAGVRVGAMAIHQETKVPPPTHPQLLFINASAVNISWDYPSGGDPLPILFSVRLSHNGTSYMDVSGMLSERRWLVYDGMLISDYYQFRVLAYFEGVASEPVSTEDFVNGITAPPGPPVSVRAYLLTPSEATVEWEGPSTPTPLLYIVYSGDNPRYLSKVKEVYQSTHVGFLGLLPASTLYIRLQADISGRLSILSEMVSVTTHPITPDITCLSCSPVSATQLHLEWQVKPFSAELHLEVAIYSLTANSSVAKVSTIGDSGNVTLDDLRPWTLYSFALSLGDLSPHSDLAFCPTNSCQTFESSPSGPPQHLELLEATGSTLTLRWSPPPLGDWNGPLTHYLLESSCPEGETPPPPEGRAWHLTPSLGPSCDVTVTRVPVIEEEEELSEVGVAKMELREVGVVLTGLTPAKLYTLRVAAATDVGGGPYSLAVTVTTSEEVINLPCEILLHVSISQDHTSTGPTSQDHTTPTGQDHTPTGSGGWGSCMQHRSLVVHWNASIAHQGTTSNGLYNVTFESSLLLISLASHLCRGSGTGDTPHCSVTSNPHCVSLDSSVVITQDWYELSPGELRALLNGTSLSDDDDDDDDGVLWLKLEMWLVNGSSLLVTSRSDSLEGLVSCAVNATAAGDEAGHLWLTLISALLPLAALSAIILIISLLAGYLYKHSKRWQLPRQLSPELLLEDCRDHTPSCNRDDTRVGDGKSSSCSLSSSAGTAATEEDSCSGSVAVTTDDASSSGSTTLDESDHDEFSPLLVGVKVHSWGVNSGGCAELSSGGSRERMEGWVSREQPDGCSVSSGSIDLGACTQVKD